MKQEIIEGNKLIAKFMGGTFSNYANNTKGWIIPNLTKNGVDGDENNLKFHSDWNWLMSVVEKIEQDGEPIEIIGNKSKTHYFTHSYSPVNKYFKTEGATKIESVYKSVIEFIKYHNEQKNK